MIRVWNNRFFMLGNGSLRYAAEEGGEVRGEFPLIGTAVTLVPYSETGQFFCFKLVSGAGSLILKSLTVNDMMSWASALYHAITVANGSGYLVEMERKRVAKEQEDARNRAEMERLRAEEEGIERERQEAEAAAAAAEAAEKAAEEEAAAAAAAAVAATQAAEEAAERAKLEADAAQRLKAEEEARAAAAAAVQASATSTRQAEAAAAAEVAARAAEANAARRAEQRLLAQKMLEEAEAAEAASLFEAAEAAERLREAKDQAEREAQEGAAETADVLRAAAGLEETDDQEGKQSMTAEELQALDQDEQEEMRLMNQGAENAEWEMMDAEVMKDETAHSVAAAALAAAGMALHSQALMANGDTDSEEEEEEKGQLAEADAPAAPASSPVRTRRLSVKDAVTSANAEADETAESVAPLQDSRSRAGTHHRRRSSSVRGSLMHGESKRRSLALLSEVDMERELRMAFDNITDGADQLAPAPFTTVVRSITNEHNLFKEMQMFQRFNLSGSGHLSRDEFVDGVMKVKDERLLAGLRGYAAKIMVSL